MDLFIWTAKKLPQNHPLLLENGYLYNGDCYKKYGESRNITICCRPLTETDYIVEVANQAKKYLPNIAYRLEISFVGIDNILDKSYDSEFDFCKRLAKEFSGILDNPNEGIFILPSNKKISYIKNKDFRKKVEDDFNDDPMLAQINKTMNFAPKALRYLKMMLLCWVLIIASSIAFIVSLIVLIASAAGGDSVNIAAAITVGISLFLIMISYMFTRILKRLINNYAKKLEEGFNNPDIMDVFSKAMGDGTDDINNFNMNTVEIDPFAIKVEENTNEK